MWTRINDIDRMFDAMDLLRSRLNRTFTEYDGSCGENYGWKVLNGSPPTNMDMPGVAKDNITVNVDNGRLEISATRKLQTKGSGSWQEFGDVEYRRVFSVPQSIDVAMLR
jgi:HSP20 family molecular chaperone IbpA